MSQGWIRAVDARVDECTDQRRGLNSRPQSTTQRELLSKVAGEVRGDRTEGAPDLEWVTAGILIQTLGSATRTY